MLRIKQVNENTVCVSFSFAHLNSDIFAKSDRGLGFDFGQVLGFKPLQTTKFILNVTNVKGGLHFYEI